MDEVTQAKAAFESSYKYAVAGADVGQLAVSLTRHALLVTGIGGAVLGIHILFDRDFVCQPTGLHVGQGGHVFYIHGREKKFLAVSQDADTGVGHFCMLERGRPVPAYPERRILERKRWTSVHFDGTI